MRPGAVFFWSRLIACLSQHPTYHGAVTISDKYSHIFARIFVPVMSRFGAKKGNRAPGAEFTWDADPGGVPDTAPTPLYPVQSHLPP